MKIDIGSKIHSISCKVNSKISNTGVPNTSTPIPIIDWIVDGTIKNENSKIYSIISVCVLNNQFN